MQLFNTVLVAFGFETILTFLIMMSVKKNDALCRAPALDWIMGLLTWIPWLTAFLWSGGWGLLGCLIGQLAFLYSFFYLHTLWRGYRGPTIHRTANRIVGRVKNQLGLLMTLPALPVFLMVRSAEIFLYPALIWTMKFPTYRHGEWVSVSRQKFSGLVGADLVWCLYCDWMTGLYALGGEMLRNLESFWCPIRFYPDKKCENCQVDFPDIKDWTPAKGTMEEVAALIEQKYPPKSNRSRAWFGHPDRKK